MPTSKPSALTIAMTTGVLTIIGAASGSIIKSFADINLERTKLDSQLILNALKAESLQQRRDTLLFLVDANLIANEETSEGLKQYFEGDNPKSPPQIQAFIKSGESQALERSGENLAQKTDVDLFVCGKDKTSAASKEWIQRTNAALNQSQRFGVGKLKVWDAALYQEIPLSKLRGKSSVIMDFNHGEYEERHELANILGNIPQLPGSVFVPNKGKQTPWRVSIVICSA